MDVKETITPKNIKIRTSFMAITLRDKIYLRFIAFKIFILLVPFGAAFCQSPDTTVYGMKNIDSKIELFCTDPLRSIEFYRKLGFKLLAQKEDLYTTMN